MRSYIRDRGWEAVKQVNDVGTGAKERSGREGVLKAARREVDVVVVWRLVLQPQIIDPFVFFLLGLVM